MRVEVCKAEKRRAQLRQQERERQALIDELNELLPWWYSAKLRSQWSWWCSDTNLIEVRYRWPFDDGKKAKICLDSKTIYVYHKPLRDVLWSFGERHGFDTLKKCWDGAAED